MSQSIKTEAFVLKKKTLLDKDLLVFLFTVEQGKTVVVAKGVKKITSRRAPHLETGNLITVMLNRKGDRLYLQETSLLSGFSELKKNPGKVRLLYQFFFVLEKLLPENQREESVYDLTKSFLIKLTQSTSNNNLLGQYLSKLLMRLGYIKKDYDLIKLEEIIFELTNDKLPDLVG
ncbi:DNA repair protein RecO [Patescibacteria group bacterium]|nr:DNA repair protein RecO [Patescibacteria group bacterium]